MSNTEQLTEALRDMLEGWKYIRSTHGDLFGVGWDRAQSKAEAALSAQSAVQEPPAGKIDGWSVTVEVNGSRILCISDNHVAGLPELDPYESIILGCADHLRSFMGAHPSSAAQAIHYPDCWDTAAYPTLESALTELYAYFKCSECESESEAQVEEIPAAVDESNPFDDQYGNAYKAGWNGYRKALLEMRALKTAEPSKGEE